MIKRKRIAKWIILVTLLCGLALFTLICISLHRVHNDTSTDVDYKSFTKRKEIVQNNQISSTFEISKNLFLLEAEELIETENESVSDLKSDHRISNEKSGTSEYDASERKTQIDSIVDAMTVEEKVAQIFFITPEALTHVNQVEIAGQVTENCFNQYPVGGIIYFENNIIGEDQFKTMLSSIQKISLNRIGLPLFLGVDEEGGSVTRIAGRGIVDTGGEVPSMWSIGQSGDSDKSYIAGERIGDYLHKIGINLNFAPVADVSSNIDTLIGERSFSSSYDVAAEMVSEIVKGFHEGGVYCTLKHFPGHGSAAGDSHTDCVINKKDLPQLQKEDLKPFISGIKAGSDFVMIGHIICPELDDSMHPASLSHFVISELLKEQLGFEGIVITDAMNMGAITNHWSSEEAAVMAFKAGADMLLMPGDFEKAFQGLLQAVSEGIISETRLNESVRKIVNLKMSFMKDVFESNSLTQEDSYDGIGVNAENNPLNNIFIEEAA